MAHISVQQHRSSNTQNTLGTKQIHTEKHSTILVNIFLRRSVRLCDLVEEDLSCKWILKKAEGNNFHKSILHMTICIRSMDMRSYRITACFQLMRLALETLHYLARVWTIWEKKFYNKRSITEIKNDRGRCTFGRSDRKISTCCSGVSGISERSEIIFDVYVSTDTPYARVRRTSRYCIAQATVLLPKSSRRREIVSSSEILFYVDMCEYRERKIIFLFMIHNFDEMNLRDNQ